MKKKIVLLTGAGMSVESGLMTFRGDDGMWSKYSMEEVGTHESWLRNPTLVTKFCNMMRQKFAKAKPNEGHKLIASLEKYFDETVVTQNVDNLHEQAGSTHVIHLHGEINKVCSSARPYDERYIRTLSPDELVVEPGTKADDGSLLRPFIVMFGEAVPMIEHAAHETMTADIFVVIGTSLQVYPAAGLLQFTKPNVPVYLIDPNAAEYSLPKNVIQIAEGATEGIKKLASQLTNDAG